MSDIEGEPGSPHLPFHHSAGAGRRRTTPLARTWRCEGLAQLTVPRLAGAWCMAAAEERAFWRKTVCSPISTFADRVGVQKKGSPPVLRIPLRCIRFSWLVR